MKSGDAGVFDARAILARLVAHGVEFVVIGGLCADVHGVGWTTLDVDIVIAPNAENYRAIIAALAELRAEFDMLNPLQRIPVTMDRLTASTGPMLLRTRHGRLDVLKEAGGDTFDTLTPEAVPVEHEGVAVRVASLEALYRMKRAADRPKDRAVLPRIEAALRARGEEPD